MKFKDRRHTFINFAINKIYLGFIEFVRAERTRRNESFQSLLRFLKIDAMF